MEINKEMKIEREREPHRCGSLATACSNIPGEIITGCLRGNELEQFWWVTRPSLRVLLCLFDEQICHLSLDHSLSLSLSITRSRSRSHSLSLLINPTVFKTFTFLRFIDFEEHRRMGLLQAAALATSMLTWWCLIK